MVRPNLSDESFLGFIFSPKKYQQPTGIRKRNLKGVKGGRKKGRLAAFNRMSAANQEMLSRFGLRDSYLRGELSLGEARKAVRPRAVAAGVARPLPGQESRPVVRVPRPLTRREQINAAVARHIKRTVVDAGKRFHGPSVDRRVTQIPDYIVEYVPEWDYQQISDAASTGSPFERIENGARFNPFWYN